VSTGGGVEDGRRQNMQSTPLSPGQWHDMPNAQAIDMYSYGTAHSPMSLQEQNPQQQARAPSLERGGGGHALGGVGGDEGKNFNQTLRQVQEENFSLRQKVDHLQTTLKNFVGNVGNSGSVPLLQVSPATSCFTCFTGTKLQILTQKALPACGSRCFRLCAWTTELKLCMPQHHNLAAEVTKPTNAGAGGPRRTRTARLRQH
jgi:hypothetical protein